MVTTHDPKNVKPMDINQEMKKLNYTPDKVKWNALSEEEQRSALIRKRNENEMKASRKLVKASFETKEFKGLPENLQAAIIRMAGKATGAGLTARPSIVKTIIAPLFAKVGSAVSELDIFMKTKMGRGEFRKKVREALKTSEPADRLWIEFNEAGESWVLLAKGGNQPKGWLGKSID